MTMNYSSRSGQSAGKPGDFDPNAPPPGAEGPQCHFLPLVSVYHDGELPEDKGREFVSHLGSCSACAASLAFFEKVSHTFSAQTVARPSPEARQRLLEAGRSIATPAFQKRGPTADVRWVRRLTAVAAVLFVVATCRLLYDRGSGNTGSPVGPVPAVHHQTADKLNDPNSTRSTPAGASDNELTQFSAPGTRPVNIPSGRHEGRANP